MKINKKHSIISILVAALMVFAMMPMMTDTVFAETVTKDGITYTLDDVNQTAVVSGHTDDLPADITIPAIVNNSYKVTAVGNSAFWNTRLESVTFETGSNLTSIGESAFADCYDIKTITIPASVTSIGKSAFISDIGLETVTFETGISLQSIEESIFQYCSNLSAITIPKSVTSIGKSAFIGDTGLETVTFEQNTELKTIGQNAFDDCASLKDITIPKA